MTIPQSFKEELRTRLPLSDVVGKRLKLVRAGREFKACCPFHKEKTPSFYINDQKGFYHCFGCGAHGDVIGFTMQHDNLSFIDAIEQLAALAGMEVPKPTPEEAAKFQHQASIYDLVEGATKWFEDQLWDPQNRDALAYLTRRGLSEETIRGFRLGFAPENGQALIEALKKTNASVDDMIEAGLARRGQKDGQPYSFFRERIMFPVTDRRGRVVAFGGRILPDELRPHANTGSTPPKYINSSDTPIFKKGTVLYSMSRAREAAGRGKPIVVVEGYTDVIALASTGFGGAVAPLGTALTEQQILELWKLSPPDNRVPILCFDGDEAGKRAAGRAAERVLPLLRPDHSVRVAFMPKGEDPDSLMRQSGSIAFQNILDQAIPLVDVLWQMELEQRACDTPESQAGFKQALYQHIQTITDRTVQDFYRQDIEEKFRSAFGGFRSTSSSTKKAFVPFQRKPRNAAEQSYRPSQVRVKPVGPAQTLRERILLATMISYPALFDEFGEELGMLPISSNMLNKLRESLVDVLSNHADLDFESVCTYLKDHGFRDELDALLDGRLYLHAAFARPGGALRDARQGWRDTWERGLAKRQSA